MAGAQMRPGGAGHAHIAVEFQCIAVLPVFLGKFQEIPAPCGAGIVHQHVQPAEAGDAAGDGVPGHRPVPEIAGIDQGADLGLGGDAGGDVMQPGFVPRGEADIHALPGQFDGDGLADSTAGARDQSDLAGKPQIHPVSPVCLAWGRMPGMPFLRKSVLCKSVWRKFGLAVE